MALIEIDRLPIIKMVDLASSLTVSHNQMVDEISKTCDFSYVQWPFQDPKLEVPTIYKAYVRPM